MSKNELEILSFENIRLFRKWLSQFHGSCPGIWLRLFKKSANEQGISYDEALQEALCFGWIDGQKKTFDKKSWLQRFTPRGKKSVWSKRNTLIIEKLTKEKRMKPSGLKVVEEAKVDGRWDKAYAPPKDMKIPDDFLEKIKKSKRAYEFFKTLDKANLYSIAWRLSTAKREETRIKRMTTIIEMLEAKKKIH